MRLVSRIRLLPAFVAVALALPATAAAQSTGGASAPEPQPATDVALVASPQALLGRKATLTGTVSRRARGRVRAGAALRRGRRRPGARRPGPRSAARAASASAGARRCSASSAIRATLQRRRSATVTNASPEVSVRVFKPAMATWYGPGLYGNTTACGQEMTQGARRRRPQVAAVRHARGGRLPRDQHRRPGRRPRAVRQGHDVGPHRGRGAAARLHRDGAHRRARPG